MKICRFPSCVGQLAACSFVVFSQFLAADDMLPTVTVDSSTPSLPQAINNANNTQLLDEDELSIAHERSITDVLQGYNGLSITNLGGYGVQSALYLRGSTGQGMLELDGVPILQYLPGLYALDGLPVEALQKSEIDRGPGAVDQPFQALGGSIRLYTQDRSETGARLFLEGGSFGILRETLQGSLAGTYGRATLTLSRGDAFEGTPLADAENNPERENYRYSQGILRFSSKLSDRLNWQGSVLYRRTSVDSDALGLDENFRVAFKDDINSYAWSNTWLAQNALHYKVAPSWDGQLQAGFTEMENFVKSGTLATGLTSRMYLATLRNRHKLMENEAQQSHWRVNWGAQARHEQGESYPGDFSQDRTLVSAFLDTEGQYRDFSGQTGVRVEHYDHFGDHPLFKTSAAWRLLPDLTLRASGGTGYRIPSYTELLSLFFGNRLLKPERSASGELTLEWFPQDSLRVNVSGYFFRYDDLIVQAYDPKHGPVSLNVSDSEVTGMELDLQYKWTEQWSSGVNYTYNDSRNLATGLDLPIRPRHTGRVWFNYQLQEWPVTLWAETIVRSSTWNDLGNTLEIGSSTKVNAAVRYAVNKRFEVYLRGENLTDNRTSQFYSINTPGAAVYGGFQLEL